MKSFKVTVGNKDFILDSKCYIAQGGQGSIYLKII